MLNDPEFVRYMVGIATLSTAIGMWILMTNPMPTKLGKWFSARAYRKMINKLKVRPNDFYYCYGYHYDGTDLDKDRMFNLKQDMVSIRSGEDGVREWKMRREV